MFFPADTSLDKDSFMWPWDLWVLLGPSQCLSSFYWILPPDLTPQDWLKMINLTTQQSSSWGDKAENSLWSLEEKIHPRQPRLNVLVIFSLQNPHSELGALQGSQVTAPSFSPYSFQKSQEFNGCPFHFGVDCASSSWGQCF
jgi:hypothetical protein